MCGEVILKDKKKEHLSRWRNTDNLLKAIVEDIEEQVSLHFDHGMNCNMQFEDKKQDPRASLSSLSGVGE